MEDKTRQRHRPPRVDVEKGPDRAFLYALLSAVPKHTHSVRTVARLDRNLSLTSLVEADLEVFSSRLANTQRRPRSLAARPSVSSSFDVSYQNPEEPERQNPRPTTSGSRHLLGTYAR